jgi:hypothetical protein
MADASHVAYDVDNRPGEWVTVKARAYSRQLLVIAGSAAVLMWIAVFIGFGLRSTGATLAIVVALLVLNRMFNRRESVARRWAVGARAERAVGEALNELRERGFVVIHDVERQFEGNIDHLVSGPTGVYMIETKSRAYLRDHLRKAKRQAGKLHDSLGVWVTPVICLSERPQMTPFRDSGVWIVPRQELLTWITSQRNRVLDFERLARFAEGV